MAPLAARRAARGRADQGGPAPAGHATGDLDAFDEDSVTGSHAAALFGYGPDHFLLRSSWGTDWGDAGYARMSNAYARAAIIESYGVMV